MWSVATKNEVMHMRFVDILGRYTSNSLSCEEAAQLLGISVSTFYRSRKRYDEKGFDGLIDQRVGKISAKRLPADKAMEIINLFETNYYDFTVKHFHEKLVSHGIQVSYTLTKNTLQNAGVVKKAPRRGKHRRKRERKPMAGMMIHQDGSTHEWVSGQQWDLIVTMDDATSHVYSMFFCDQEGTISSFRGIRDVILTKGLFCTFYVDRGSHYFNTPEAGGKVDKNNLTQVGRAMQQLGIEMIAAYSPEARGRSERMFQTLQHRLPQELRIACIHDMESANAYINNTFLQEHNARFSTKSIDIENAFVPCDGIDINEYLSIHEERTVSNDNTIRYKNKTIQLSSDKHRTHYVKTKVQVHEYIDGSIGVFHGPRRLQAEAPISSASPKEYPSEPASLVPNEPQAA